MTNARERLQLINSFYKEALETRFPSMISYAFQAGSVVYGGGTLGKSDLDITVVFNDDIHSVSHLKFLEKLKSFIPDYLLIHKRTGFNPDLTFPGEYISESMVVDAINGRGFAVDSGYLSLPRASKEYYLASDEHVFRSLRSQLAFNKFVTGDYELFSSNKERAWGTIIKFTLSSSDQEVWSIDKLASSLKIFGVHQDYWDFLELELPWVRKALSRLYTEGFIIFLEQDTFSGTPTLFDWNRELANSITDGSVRKAGILADLETMSELSELTISLWESKMASLNN